MVSFHLLKGLRDGQECLCFSEFPHTSLRKIEDFHCSDECSGDKLQACGGSKASKHISIFVASESLAHSSDFHMCITYHKMYDISFALISKKVRIKKNRSKYPYVSNDILGQTHSLASSEHCFHLKFILFWKVGTDGRTTCPKAMITAGRDCVDLVDQYPCVICNLYMT